MAAALKLAKGDGAFRPVGQRNPGEDAGMQLAKAAMAEELLEIPIQCSPIRRIRADPAQFVVRKAMFAAVDPGARRQYANFRIVLRARKSSQF
ncbi:hypothetical protein [Brevundimonas sp. TWP2-3-2]|uniref:hypothetical protein n=1 Tax=unclassified Brevundimonas TaxID=2622653 RepID=UPI003CFAFBF9